MEIVIQLVMKLLNRLAINIMNSLLKRFWHLIKFGKHKDSKWVHCFANQ